MFPLSITPFYCHAADVNVQEHLDYRQGMTYSKEYDLGLEVAIEHLEREALAG